MGIKNRGDIPRELYNTGTLDNLTRRFPKNVIDIILSKLDLTWEDLKKHNVGFTFYPDMSEGCTRREQCRCSDRRHADADVIAVNVDFDLVSKHTPDEIANPVYFTLIHELAHVADMIKGRLVQSEDGTIWEGKLFPKESLQRVRQTIVEGNRFASSLAHQEYKNWPWEESADKRASKLTSELVAGGIIQHHSVVGADNGGMKWDTMAETTKAVKRWEKKTGRRIPILDGGLPPDVMAALKNGIDQIIRGLAEDDDDTPSIPPIFGNAAGKSQVIKLGKGAFLIAIENDPNELPN